MNSDIIVTGISLRKSKYFALGYKKKIRYCPYKFGVGILVNQMKLSFSFVYILL